MFLLPFVFSVRGYLKVNNKVDRPIIQHPRARIGKSIICKKSTCIRENNNKIIADSKKLSEIATKITNTANLLILDTPKKESLVLFKSLWASLSSIGNESYPKLDTPDGDAQPFTYGGAL
jgi:hypothetical protein